MNAVGTDHSSSSKSLHSHAPSPPGTNLKRNFSFNLLGLILPMGVTLITVPIYFAHIGAQRYGVLSIVWILLGYFGFLDFGLSRATTNALARLSNHPVVERSRVLATALLLNLSLGLFGALVLYSVGGILVAHILKLPTGLSAEVREAFPWIACMLPIALVTAVGRGSIDAREHFLAVNLLDFAGVVLGQVLPVLCVVFIGPELTVVIPATFSASLISAVLMLSFIARTEPIISLRAFDKGRVKELFGYGAWVSVSNVISPLLTTIDQIIIGRMLGAAAVAYYSVPMNLVARSQTMASALGRTLFPRFARLGAEEARRLAEKTVISLAYAFCSICGPAIIFGKSFLALWMGPAFASYAGPIVQILMIGAWANGVAFIPFSLLQAQGRPDLVAKIHAMELLPFIAVLWLLLERFGLSGAALAWVLRVSVDAVLMFGAARFTLWHMTRLTPAIVLLLVSYPVACAVGDSILWSAFFSVVIAGIGGVATLTFDPASRQLLFQLGDRFAKATG
jgi:O-antigen/teichoic acid export membrane protein